MPSADHPEYAALLRAIRAEPDDDTPRLVCADWLEEHDDADRAAFIRIQVELARLEAAGLGKGLEADALRKKERAYLGPYSYHRLVFAMEACPGLVRQSPESATIQIDGAEWVTFRRGFVEEVRCPAGEWFRHGLAVRGRQPVREVALSFCSRLTRDDWYAMFPALRGLRTLYLDLYDREMSGWLADRLPGVRVTDDIPF